MHHLVGASEVARILGVSRQRVAQLATSDGFPRPEAELSCGRIWTRQSIDDWSAIHSDREIRFRSDYKIGSVALPAALEEVRSLSVKQALGLRHRWIGPEHILLALLQPTCPGRAREVLESLGIDGPSMHRVIVNLHGDPFLSPVSGSMLSRSAELILETARRKAVEAGDDVATSEHVLLALTDQWERQAGTGLLSARGLDPSIVIERVLRLSDQPAPASVVELGPWPERKAPPSTLTLAPSPIGKDPWNRKPWGSAYLRRDKGDSSTTSPRSRQYFFDRDGYPVLTITGKAVHLRMNNDGTMARSEAGELELCEVDIPEGWRFRSHQPL